MRRGVHEHLPFGDGEIDFPPVLEALAATGYQGLTVVELPRHSHAGPYFAQQSLSFLRHAAAPTAPPAERVRTSSRLTSAAPQDHPLAVPVGESAAAPEGRTP